MPRLKKVNLYRSLVESKHLCGQSCCCLTVAQQRRLNGFQARCLRKVLGVKSAYISRVSNSDILRMAGHTQASELLLSAQLVQFGKAMRAPQSSPLHRAGWTGGTDEPAVSYYVRRVGRPRKEWVPTVLNEARRRNASGTPIRDLARDESMWKHHICS